MGTSDNKTIPFQLLRSSLWSNKFKNSVLFTLSQEEWFPIHISAPTYVKKGPSDFILSKCRIQSQVKAQKLPKKAMFVHVPHKSWHHDIRDRKHSVGRSKVKNSRNFLHSKLLYYVSCSIGLCKLISPHTLGIKIKTYCLVLVLLLLVWRQ